MSIQLSDNIRVGQQKPLDGKYFNNLIPYTSTTQANSLIVTAERHIGLPVNINNVEYWYGNGILDTNLIIKNPSFSGGTITGTTFFTNGLSATTISATTYYGLPLDIKVTGGTFTNITGNTIQFTNNTGGTFNVLNIETSLNKQIDMSVDVSGIKYPVVNAVNVQSNTMLKSSSSTGFIDRLDTFNMALSSSTVISVTGTSAGAFIRTKLFSPPAAPSDAFVNFSGRTFLASSISLTGDGRYFRYLGYDYFDDTIKASEVNYLFIDSIVGLAYVEVLRNGGVNTFTALQLEPDISTTALFSNIMIANQSTTTVFPNNNLSVHSTNGTIKAHGINWGSLNLHTKPISGSTPLSFIRINPSYLTTSTGFSATTIVDTTTYWDGSNLVSVGGPNNASIQRWLITLDGRIWLQAGNASYSNKASAEADLPSVIFDTILPTDISIELCRMITTKSASDLTDTTKAQFYYTSSGGGSSSSNASFGTLGGSPYDNILLGIELNKKINIYSGTTNILPKNNGFSGFTDSNIFDNGSLVTINSNTNILSGLTANTIQTNTITIGSSLVNEDLVKTYNFDASTGVYEFSGITLNTGNTFNIALVKGYSYNTTNVTNPIPIPINYSGVTGITTPYLLTAPATYISLSSGGTLTLSPTAPDEVYYRHNILLGVIGHPSGTLTGVGNRPDVIFDTADQFRDMFRPIRLINDGIYCYPNDANLTIANTAGKLYGLGIGFVQNGKNSPTTLSVSGNTPLTFQYRVQTGGTFSNTTNIDPLFYDVNGVRTAVPGGAANSTNQRIYLLENGNVRIQYGQTFYTSLPNAIAGAQNESFTVFSNNKLLGVLIGILSIQRGCTDLSNTTTARFLSVSKFGETVGAAAGITTATLQSAYNNSIQPEITTNSILGAVNIQRGSASDNDSVFGTLNGSGTNTFIVNGFGNVTGTTFVKSGGTSNQFLMADGGVSYVTPILKQEYVYTSGPQNFTTSQNFSQVYSVSVQGGGPLKSDQYVLSGSNIVTITDTLDSGDYIVILYTTISGGTFPFYTQAQTDTLLNLKMDKQRQTKIVSATTYTLLSSDSDKTLYFTSSSACTLTIPSGLTLGNSYEVFQQGTGQVSFVGSGATIRISSQELAMTSERYSLVGIDSIANVTEEVHIYGALFAI